MTAEDVDWLLAMPPFDRMDPDQFSLSAPLREILRNDARILKLRRGDIVVREGDYGNSAFLILTGAVHLDISPEPALPAPVLGRSEPERKTFFESVAQLWNRPPYPEVRDDVQSARPAMTGSRQEADGSVQMFLQDVPAVLERCQTVTLEAGELFGEVAALGRIPRPATAFADGEAELLEIRWQGLRDIMRRDLELQRHIDEIYRERNLPYHILASPIFQHLTHRNAPPDCACGKCTALRDIVDKTKFETWGDFDWHTTYKRLVDQTGGAEIEHEPVIAEEGHYPNGVYLVRSGFARVSKRFGDDHRTLAYLGRGQTYGLPETVHNWRNGGQVPLQHSLRAVGYTAVLLVPTAVVERYVLGPDPAAPLVEASLLSPRIESPEAEPAADRVEAAGIDQNILEFFVANRFINGTAAMVINLDRCTQCDDCVRACASTHDNNPRFIRHGPKVGNVMVANACMHCADPVCMIGCPTGAIHRNALGGEVVINDATCIGCGTCANSCPYDNIRMVEARNSRGEPILDLQSGMPILKATNCDLCESQLGGPACARACPHDALSRVDLNQDLGSLAEWARL